ncbi:MAG: hypothetical protein JWM80_1825 [Cyanobacteria bacterium RYN_339]|nr:hypothetical protein [Cyanobacteria bacterium RYN_339]
MELVKTSTPEDRDRALRQAELGRLERDMAEREAALADLKAALAAFELRYWQAFAVPYAALDELEATIAEKAARLDPDDNTKRRKAERLRARADGLVAAPEPEERAQPDDELKAVYRSLSKRVHPDLAADEDERRQREVQMAEVNAAYRRGDVAWLSQRLLGQEPGDTLALLDAQIAVVEQRLTQADATLATLEATPLAKLMRHEARARSEGRDLFARMLRELEEVEQALKKRQKTLDRRLGKRLMGGPS